MEKRHALLPGDCLEVLKELPDNSMDSLVTDPPAGIAFMGKEWDEDKGGRKQWVAWMTDVMREALRVLKPGAHGLVWALPRTSHWTATALEDAGFEVRDVVTHLFGTGFPKSMDISKAIDKAAGVERDRYNRPAFGGKFSDDNGQTYGTALSNIPATKAAKQWAGWGTALKPASEHWILVRKPLSEKTVAANVLKHGTGGINIDASRIEIVGDRRSPAGADGKIHRTTGSTYAAATTGEVFDLTKGRFPANLVLDEEAAAALDAQSGDRPGFKGQIIKPGTSNFAHTGASKVKTETFFPGYDDSGGASRFFFVHKDNNKCDNANIVKMNLNQLNELGAFVQKLAVISERPATNLSDTLRAFISETQIVLKGSVALSTEMTLNTVVRFSHELLLISTLSKNPVRVAESQMLIDTMRIIHDLLTSDSFVDGATSNTTSKLTGLGVPGLANRFIYQSKASKRDKGEGNTHPTVKSTELMTYLIKLITPPGGIVLDPFTGSGSTGVAALRNGFDFIGIEQSEEYGAIAEARLDSAYHTAETVEAQATTDTLAE